MIDIYSKRLHNHFDIVITDIKTGEVDTRFAENVVLNQSYTDMITSDAFEAGLHQISVGKGTSQPQVTDTNLQSLLMTKRNDLTWDKSQVKVGGTGVCKYTSTIRIEASELVGETITEVGFRGVSKQTTRALIQDANGNPLAIVKTNTMVVDIYATAYYVEPKEVNGFKVCGGPNTSIANLSANTNNFFGFLNGIRLSPIRMNKNWYEEPNFSRVKDPGLDLNMTVVKDLPNKKRSYSYSSVAAGSANFYGIRAIRIGIYSGSFIEIPVPNNNIIQPLITKEVVGSGDGVNKIFRTKFGWIKDNGTAKVFINDVEQTSGVSITFDTANPNVFSTMFRNIDGYAKEVENKSGMPVHSITAAAQYGGDIYVRDNTSDSWVHIGYLSPGGTLVIPEIHRNKKYWKNGNARFDTMHTLQPDPDIVFDTPPPAGSTIAVTYQPDCLAKDETKILNNISYAFTMNI